MLLSISILLSYCCLCYFIVIVLLVYTSVVVDRIVCLLYYCCFFFFFFKQKTAYEMRISDWGSDVCSSVPSSARLTVNCIHALRLIPRRLAAASTFASNARSKRSITGDLRCSAPCPASSASVAIGSAFGLAAPAMKASAAASSIGDLGLLFGLRAIAIEIHSAIIMLYKYRADQCGQLVDRLGVTR